jgi:serine/threonine protein kinase
VVRLSADHPLRRPSLLAVQYECCCPLHAWLRGILVKFRRIVATSSSMLQAARLTKAFSWRRSLTGQARPAANIVLYPCFIALRGNGPGVCCAVTGRGCVVVQELQSADPQRLGPYRLVGRLGSGGMGRVFLGRSAGGRLVAVKVIREDLAADPEFRARFGREVAAARQVGGLFTALVVDADVDGTMPWLATTYVAGPSPAEAVSQYGPLPPESVLSLAAGLAEGLSAIHASGLVHRDLKPSNVLLADDGPRVIDFGISRAGEMSVLTRTGLVVGSPGFMSTEQAEGREVGPASDVFSLVF